MKTNIRFFIISRLFVLRMRNVSDKVIEKIEAVQQHFPENRAVYEIMWKSNCRAVQATYGNMARAHCVVNN